MNDGDRYIPGYSNRPGTFTLVLVSTLCSTALTLSALYGLAALGLFPALPASAAGSAATETRVPHVVGMLATAADELLAARKLRLVVTERRSDKSAPAGTIVAQAPLAESRVPLSSELSVVVSTGPIKQRVPDVVGKSVAEATAAVEALGLIVGASTESNEGEPGKVLGIVPLPGTELDPGSTVALKIASAKVAVPELIGLHVAKAREAIEQAGFSVGRISEIYDHRRKGNLVLQQKPDPDEHAAKGSAIDLVINQGD